MRIDVFTIFPEMVDGFAGAEPARARPRQRGLLDVRVHDLRDQAPPTPHRTVDDAPFGGGAGMVLMPEPIFAAVEAVDPPRPLFFLGPAGAGSTRRWRARAGRAATASPCCAAATRASTSGCATTSSTASCRSATTCSAGARWRPWSCSRRSAGWCPGVMGNDASADEESFSDGLLEYPQYTRPAEFRGWEVPEVLRSGDHARVARWRRAQALRRTLASAAPTSSRPAAGSRDEERRAASAEFDLLRRPGAYPRLSHRHRRCDRVPRSVAMKPTDLVDQSSLRDDVPDFAPGDTLKVHVRVVEGTKERVQVFQGAVIRRQGDGLRETFTVRKVTFGVGVERTFPVHSPIVAKIEVVTRGDVRRAKLYYLRDRVGKAAKIKEKRER